jgi:hypothetical protein
MVNFMRRTENLTELANTLGVRREGRPRHGNGVERVI